MNKIKKVSYLLLVISFLGFNCISCSDDDEIREEEYVGEVFVVDELEVLQNSLAKVDEKGNLVERVLGVSLDAADPDEVSVGVEGYDEAVEIFTNLFADTTVVSNNGTLATFAVKEGKAELVATSDADGQVAYATFDVPGLKHVSKVNFILNSAWPDNAGGKGYHKFGVIYEAKGWTGKGYLAQNDYIKPNTMFKYLCIREYSNGKPALLFAICTDKFALHPRSLSSAGGNIPNEQKAKEIASILQKDWNTYKKRMKDAYGIDVLGEGDNFTYWINRARDHGFWVNQYYIRLKDSKVDWNDTHNKDTNRFTLFYMESGQKM